MRTYSRKLRSRLGFVLGIPIFFAIHIGTLGCRSSDSPNTPGDGGAGGEGGCPVRLPEPQFILEIRAEDGPVPVDTRVGAEWSAANEPPFVLSNPDTWKTLDDSVNLICIVDRNQPPPADLSVLVCELWTSGAVNLSVAGTGYTPYEETLKPVMSELCGEPMSTTLSIMLHRPLPDAGISP
jgi:hypothetical protein